MEDSNIQHKFFNAIKEQLPAQTSLTDVIADVLNISTDSAFRKISGEKSLDIDELKTLSLHFRISVDEILKMDNPAIMFNSNAVEANIHFQFERYLQNLIKDLALVNSFEDKKIFYLNKDFPIFHYFQYPELAAFKCFFWTRSIVNDPDYLKEKFSIEKYLPAFKAAAEKINNLYYQIPSVEIWNLENINSTIHQIDYYRHSKAFTSPDDITTLYDCLYKTIVHIEAQAEAGYKFPLHNPAQKCSSYEVYFNEFILGDNSIMACLNDKKIVYINHAVISYMTTTDERFCNFTENAFQNLIKRSTLISAINEKERIQFFNKMYEKIDSKKSVLV